MTDVDPTTGPQAAGGSRLRLTGLLAEGQGQEGTSPGSRMRRRHGRPAQRPAAVTSQRQSTPAPRLEDTAVLPFVVSDSPAPATRNASGVEDTAVLSALTTEDRPRGDEPTRVLPVVTALRPAGAGAQAATARRRWRVWVMPVALGGAVIGAGLALNLSGAHRPVSVPSAVVSSPPVRMPTPELVTPVATPASPVGASPSQGAIPPAARRVPDRVDRRYSSGGSGPDAGRLIDNGLDLGCQLGRQFLDSPEAHEACRSLGY